MIAIGTYDHDADLIEATQRDGQTRVRVYQVDHVLVVLGRASDYQTELQSQACIRDGVRVVRRHGGGCAVVLDPGDVIVSAVLTAPGITDNQRYFERLSAWLIDGLTRAGISNVHWDGISDLVVQDRKVGGSCIHRGAGVLYYAASLLVSPNIELMERYLAHPPREAAYRRGRRHSDFVAPLLHKTPGQRPSDLAAQLVRRLKDCLKLPVIEPPPIRPD